ncbi:methyl-accepting chemotaxis protein, partial [Bordetella genomosp. 5]
MLANLKIRTGLLLALLVLALCALASIGLGLDATRQANAALDTIDSLSVQQNTLLKDTYAQMLRATIRADIAAGQMRAGDARGAAENTRLVRELHADASKKIETFAGIPKRTELGRKNETEVVAAFKSFASALDEMMSALDRNDEKTYLDLKNSKAGAASGAFAAKLTAFSANIETMSEKTLGDYRQTSNIMMVLYGVFVALILLVVVLAYLFMTRAVVRPLTRAGEQFERIAAGDLTQRVEVHGRNEVGQLMAAIKRMQESLTRTVSQVRRGVDEINVGSREIAAGNTDLSSRTEQQAASLEETAASMEQLASTVKQNADNARQANQLAASASDVAERGGSAVSEVVHTMEGISASSRKISEIVSVIDGIAFQTNILALNAAVEAARAGEQGKGFAVVAGEVRSLAQRSAQAAKEIKLLIEDSVSKVGTGSQQVERAGATMQEIVASVKRVTDIMGEISAASDEQSGGIDQVNRAVAQMDEVTQQNAALVEQAAAAAGSLQEQAERLADAVSVFKINAGEVIEVPARHLAPQAPPVRVQASRAPAPARPQPASRAPRLAAATAAPAPTEDTASVDAEPPVTPENETPHDDAPAAAPAPTAARSPAARPAAAPAR